MTQGYADISRSFDRFAERYDADVEPNSIHAGLRRRSLAWLDQAFGEGMHVLEVGCGTGTEALHLAQRGVEVTAIDISESMVQQAQRRIEEANLTDRVHVSRAASADIATRFAAESFDGAYASLGGLNCGPDLASVAGHLARVMKTGTVFITSVLSRPCAWEVIGESLSFHPAKAFRRLRDPTTINLAPDMPLEVHVHSEGDLRRAFSTHFQIERLEGWLLTIPPPYLDELWDRVPILHAPAKRADDFLGSRWPFRGWGEHIHMWARRCG